MIDKSKYGNFKQSIHQESYLASGVVVVGNVTIEEGSSIWYNSVVRGDVAPVSIGSKSNIQESCVIHTNWNIETVIGNYVTVGHGAILHGCKIGDNTLIGMGAIILDGVEIGKNCIIGAGTLITQHKKIPDGSMVYGNPFQIIRQLTQEEIESLTRQAEEYVFYAKALL
ncbi:MAG: gamma carbonic anhydrase family protein [Deltaproteobacteria bacterium]